MYTLFLFLFIGELSVWIEGVTNVETLRLVHLMYRHGDRSPTHLYAGDPVKESDWPQGLGQLTRKGMQQGYHLGQILRKRYLQSGFMNLGYKFSEIRVRSTDRDRALMTAYSVLAGLYPPEESQKWNKEFPWQPIPVHTVPLTDDYLLRDDAPCPKFDRLVDEFRNSSEELRDYIIKNQDLMQLIQSKTQEPGNVLGLFRVLDPVHCERIHEKDLNLSLPDWIKNDTVATRLRDTMHFASSIRFPTTAIARLRGGLLVKSMVDHAENLISGDTNIKKMYMYSAHDTSINSFMNSMKVYNKLAPPFTACVTVELHEPSSGKYDIRIFYRNETDSEIFHQVQIPGCSVNCPLDTFKSLMKDVMIDDIHKECGESGGADQNVTKTTSNLVVGIAVLGCLVGLLLIIVIAVVIIFRKKQHYYSYRALPVDTI